MKKLFLFFIGGILALTGALSSSCGHNNDEPNTEPVDSVVFPDVVWDEDSPAHAFATVIPPAVSPIDGLSVDNFPVIDGSDSTEPLRMMLASALTDGFTCIWIPWVTDGALWLLPSYTDASEEEVERIHTVFKHFKYSNTHPSYVNLIDRTVDIIICARESSDDEINYAQEKGVTLIEKPIALDSFAFLLNRINGINNLSHEQIVGIYSGQITNWKEVGGKDTTIVAFTRNRNSGSQEKMEKLVMRGVPMIDLPELRGGSMMAPYQSIMASYYGIAYSPYYYYINMSESFRLVKAISVNNVPPTKQYIRSREYPFVSEVCACIRRDEPADSYARKIFDYLTTSDGKKIIEASGFVAN